MIPLLSTTRLFSLLEGIRTSYWFLPSAMVLISIAISFGLLRVDSLVNARAIEELGWIYVFGPEGARAILSVIASSMITVAGLTFSITMLTLQLASSQFGPRLLRNFMRDRGSQIVLGTFVATFIYCLLVLRTVRGIEGESFVPHISVAFSVLLALAGIGVLIYFIHHVASSIRIETLLNNLAAEAQSSLDRLYPEHVGDTSREGRPLHGPPAGLSGAVRQVVAGVSGYVQQLDAGALMKTATAQDLVVRVEARPGRFITPTDAIFSVGTTDVLSKGVENELRAAVAIGQERTPEQDLEYTVRRIVEIAQRALSPGVNDPTTALYCVDRIEQTLRRMAGRSLPASARYDESNRVRVITEAVSLDQLGTDALTAIARYAERDRDVLDRLSAALSRTIGSAKGHPVEGMTTLLNRLRARTRSEFTF